MRGAEDKQASMIALISPSSVVPADHPLRAIKVRADAALADLSPLFDSMYAASGRPSIPPETLLKAQLLIALYSIRSERMFCEQLRYNLLFRWFLDMDLASEPFDATTFTKNRERLLVHDVCGEFFRHVVEQARKERLLSSDHFTVDGTLIEAMASMKSFVPKDGSDDPPPPSSSGKGGKTRIKKGGRNRWVNFRGVKRSNVTHASTTDPEARLARKGRGQASKLSYSLHALMENRHGFLADVVVDLATGTAERDVALRMLAAVPRNGRITVGADKGYDARDFVEQCRGLGVTPHVAQNAGWRRRSAVDGRTTRHSGYAVSQRLRMRVEEIFGWGKTVGGLRRTRFKGRDRTQMWAYVVGAALNLLRMGKLAAA
jgi:transposase